LLQFANRQASPTTLIGERRIRETVADNPPAARQGRRDPPYDMVTPRRTEQQSLADRVPTLGLAFQQQAPDRLGSRRAAGLAGALGADAARCNAANKPFAWVDFAGALAALDSDKAAALYRLVGIG
jgi:hypothetical protein